MSITQEVSHSQEDSKLSVLTYARQLVREYPNFEDLPISEIDDDSVFLAAIFDRLDKLVTIVERIKIPRMLL